MPKPEDDKNDDGANNDSELQSKNEDLTRRLEDLERKQNDPNYIDTLHRSHFGEPKDPNADKNNEDPDPKPTFETLNTDGMSNDQVVAEMQKRQDAVVEWQSRQVDKKFSARDNEAAQREQERMQNEEIRRIQSFRDQTEDFDSYKEQIRDVYGKPLTIEDSYKFVKWQKLAKEAEESGTRRPAARSSDSKDNTNLNKTFETVEAGASAAFDEVMQGVDLDTI